MALFANAQQLDSKSVETKSCDVEVKIGFMLNPQGVILFDKPFTGFEYEIPTFFVFVLKKEAISLTPFYSIAGNTFGGFIEYEFDNGGTYVVANKSTKTSNIYIGIGASLKVADEKAGAFIEVGRSSLEGFSSCIGVSIPLVRTLNNNKN